MPHDTDVASTLHKHADLLQKFAAQSNRELPRGEALNQAAILAGYEDYENAIEAQDDSSCAATHTASSGEINSELSAWDRAMSGGSGVYEVNQDSDHVTVKLCSEDSPETSIEVTIDMDGGLPRVMISRPDDMEEPLFSMHASSLGTTIQYMSESVALLDRSSAPKEAEKLLRRLTNSSMPSWFIPTPEEV